MDKEATQPGIGIYATPDGVAFVIVDGEDRHTLMLDPDDAGRIAVNLLTQVAIFQVNANMRQAMERAEVEKVKQMLAQSKGVDLSAIREK